jgi:hypothetical protein
VTIWRWHFNDVESLQQALREYASFNDSTKVARYGEEEGGGGMSADGDKHFCVLRQNAEIDARMKVLRDTAPIFYRLLDAYYRKAMCYEAKGWAVAAKRSGLPCNPKSKYHRRAFGQVCSLAVNELFYTHAVYVESCLANDADCAVDTHVPSMLSS